MRGRPLVTIVAATLGALALTACGGGAGGDTASFDMHGNVISVTENGTATISQGVPPIDYSGPLGCRGRYFDTEDDSGFPLDFRYTARDAYLLVGGLLYHLASGPVQAGRALHWSVNADGGTVRVTVDCPLPSTALPPLSAAFPSACELLTRTIATGVLGRGVGRAQFTQQGPFDTYCSYQTDQLGLVSLDVGDAAVTKAELSWRAPAVSGLGVPAHAPTTDDSLVAVKGVIGIEVVVSLGGSQAADTAAEERVAQAVLAGVPG